MNNILNNVQAFEKNLVCVKAMIFQKKLETESNLYVPVLCCVPEEDYHETCHGKICAYAQGTLIRFGAGFYNSGTVYPMSLTAYERYLEKEGWSFVSTVPMAKGKKKFEAIKICREVIRIVAKTLR